LGGRFVVSFFILLYVYSTKMYSYSGALHTSYKGGKNHYTVFGFYEGGGELKQIWAMHINEDGSSTIVSSKKRMIFWSEVRTP